MRYRKCQCLEVGKDGKIEHRGKTTPIIRNSLANESRYSRSMKACANHLPNYLDSGIWRKVRNPESTD